MLPAWIRDFKLPKFPEFELPKLENLTMPDFKLKENWDKFTSSIPQWIKDNIFDPGKAGRGGSGGGSVSGRMPEQRSRNRPKTRTIPVMNANPIAPDHFAFA